MIPPIPDLWPQLDEQPQTPPIAILRQQGVWLGQRTANLVYGEVLTKAFPGQGEFLHVLWVVAPFLGFRKPLVAAAHKVGLYPVQVGPALEATPGHIVPSPQMPATSPEEFMQLLQTILASDDNVKLLSALIAQSTEPIPA